MQGFVWTTPSPLWSPPRSDTRRDNDVFFRPRIFELAGDGFMDQFLNALGAGRLGTLPEPAVKNADNVSKLFHPAHGRFYVVSASICCREMGFPDRWVRAKDAEKVSFVVRRRLVMKGGPVREFAWVSEGAGKGWHEVTASSGSVLAQSAAHGPEQVLPLVVVAAPKQRRVAYGLIPVAQRQEYVGGGTNLQTGSGNVVRDALDDLDARFFIPVMGLANPTAPRVTLPWVPPPPPPPPAAPEPYTIPNPYKGPLGGEDSQRISAFLLLDLLDFLREKLPEVGRAVTSQTGSFGVFGELVAKLEQGTSNILSIAGALRVAAAHEAELHTLGDAELSSLGAIVLPDFGPGPSGRIVDVVRDTLRPAFERALQDALPWGDVTSATTDSIGSEHYVVRCVYERPLCPQRPYWVSRESIPFVPATFYDPDAPVRPVIVELPPDMSLSALRRSKGGVTFVATKELNDKLRSVPQSLEDLAAGKKGSASWPPLGFICSFSIPIITICAFILLYIIVNVLNIIFWWMPYFRVCLPLNLSAPKLK